MPEETALYRLFASNDVLLYVGISKGPYGRISDHRRTKPWSILIDHYTVEWHPSRYGALRREAVAIRDEAPLFNIDHNQDRDRPWVRMLEAWQTRSRPGISSWLRIQQFAAVAAEEPAVLELLTWVLQLGDRERCGECLWSDIRNSASTLVGYGATNEAVRDSGSYEVVISTLYECLPWCICERHGAA